jgi:ribosome-associated protein
MSKLIINKSIQIPYDEFEFSAVRSQGPGGQNVNKVSSKVVLRWAFGRSPHLPEGVRERLRMRARRFVSQADELTITSQRSRHQAINREDCLRKLRLIVLDAATPPVPRKPTKPTRASVQRRRRDKALTSLKKQQRLPPKPEG